MSVIYAGVFLEEASVEKLWGWWESKRGPLLDKMHCHHMTVAFKPDRALLEAFPLKVHCTLTVMGWMSDEFCQVVRVKPSCALAFPVENKAPHITVATHKKSPAYANELLEELGAVGVIAGPTLSGWTGLYVSGSNQPLWRLPDEGATVTELAEQLK